MTDIKRTMIASLLIEQATELKGKRPTQLNFEELIDVVESVVKKLTIPVVLRRSEQLKCGNSNPPCSPNIKFGCLECTECNWSE